MQTSLTKDLAHGLCQSTGLAKREEFIVLVELTEGHAQAVIREDQEHFVQQVRQVLQIQLWGDGERKRE